MSSRRHFPPSYEGRSQQAPGMIRHGPLPVAHRPMEPLPPPELLENKLAVQAAEIEQLTGDNHRLAASHVALRQDLAAAEQEIQKLREHIRSIQSESDIQIRVLLEKISKMEADIRDGESVKKELKQAHIEARNLVMRNQELSAKIKQAAQELEKARVDVKKLPEMHAELDSLRQEHQNLRTTFEYEKRLNIEKVEQMQLMEKDLVAMAKQMEKLRAEVLNAEKRARGLDPLGHPYSIPDPMYLPPMHGTAGYIGAYGRAARTSIGPVGEGVIPYGSGFTAATGAAGASGGNSTRAGVNDVSHARR